MKKKLFFIPFFLLVIRGHAQNPAPLWSLTGNGNATSNSKLGTTNAINLSLYTSNFERMRITAAGYVGIGTKSPSTALNVNSRAGKGAFKAQVNGVTKLFVHSGGGVAIGEYATPPANGLYVAGNVGIGTTSPAYKLDVSGDINIGSPGGLRISGLRILKYDAINVNLAIGDNALVSNTSGSGNTAAGSFALYSNTTGSYNVAYGYHALYSSTSIYSNTAVGYQSMYANTTGSYNSGVGVYALGNNTTGGYNVGVGLLALYNVTSGSENTGIGNYSDVSDGTFYDATAIGYGAVATASNQVMLGSTSVNSVKAAGSFVIYSDGRYKKDVRENVPGLAFINQLRSVTYHYDIHGMNDKMGIKAIQNKKMNAFKAAGNSDAGKAMEDAISTKEKKLYTGFVAQEVEATANKLNYDFSGVYKPQNDKDLYGLSYADFVVPLVKAVQELSKQNDSLKQTNLALQSDYALSCQRLNDINAKITRIENAISHCCSSFSNMPLTAPSQQSVTSSDLPKLDQNLPNPFNGSSYIGYYIPSGSHNTKLIITDISGHVLKTYSIARSGLGNQPIYANEFESGMYEYSLVIDGKLIDTKKMILGK